MLLHCNLVTLLHHKAVTLLYCYTVMCLQCNIVRLLGCLQRNTATLFTQLHCLHSYTVTHVYLDTLTTGHYDTSWCDMSHAWEPK